MYGFSGNSSLLFWEPSDVTLDPMGNAYVVDTHNHRVQFLFASQSNGITIAGITGVSGLNATMLDSPTSSILDHQLNLYATKNISVEIFIC
jgi:hypothetical protein